MDKSDKVALRAHFRKVRLEIGREDREQWDSAIAQRVLGLGEVQQAQVIFSYLAQWGEVATAGILEALMQQGKTVLVPDPSHKALPAEGCHVLTMAAGQPQRERYTGELCHRGDVDVFFVPGIVWSPDGYRVGFGGGYFDRLLSGRKAGSLAVGLGYDCQVVDKVPREEWDERVDVLVTESGVFWGG